MRQQFEDWLAQVADDNDTARAERLAELFERSRFTRQKDLAEAVGVETRTVQRWLAGEGIAKRHWTELAELLDTTVRWLLFGEEEERRIEQSQLDRIEAKLDEVLMLLSGELPEALEQAADQADAQRRQSVAKPQRRSAKRTGS